MVCETRSGRHSRNEVVDDKLKNGNDTPVHCTSVPVVRKSGSETPLSEQTTPSPQSARKSKRPEKGTPASTRKSGRLEKNSTPSPSNRQNTGHKKSSPSLDSKQSASFSEDKRKKEKNLSQVVMESERAQVQLERTGKKRKKMTLRRFKMHFKVQRLEGTITDVDGEFQGPDEGPATLSVDATVMDNVVDEPLETQNGDGLEDSRASPRNCSTTVDSPKSESSTCLEKLRDGDAHSGSGGKCVSSGAPDNASESPQSANHSPSRTPVQCSQDKGTSFGSPEKELCSRDGAFITEPDSSSFCKDRGDHVAAASAEKCESKNLLEKPHSEAQKDGHGNTCTNCNSGEILCCEEEGGKRCSRFIDGSTSRFLEYWLPVQISNHQLEQYCATLLSNASPLRSSSKIDPVGALQKILPTVRKCCAHPYLEDLSVQARQIAEGRPAIEVLETGIKASGKLQLLDLILAEIKTRKLQVLILFQLILGSGGVSTGDILDDFLRHRFGPHSYERVDAGITPSRKQAAVNRFNKKETGQFVLLLENRACSSTIKLLSLDIVIVYDSDWKPVNDLRALQKISVDSKVERIKVLRLYSVCTMEEKALLFAKQSINIDNSLQTSSRGATSDNLLMWGASQLFSRLDEYHADNSSALNNSSEQMLFTKVMQELSSILSESCGSTDTNSVISKVQFDVGRYKVNTPLLGEAVVRLKEGEEPHVFWRNLLDRKIPQWKLLGASSPRNRKRVNYFDASPSKLESETDDVGKKRRRVVNENGDPPSAQGEQATQFAGPEGGPSTIAACNQSQSLTSENNANRVSSLGPVAAEVDAVELDVKVASSSEQKSLHSFLQEEMTRLCQVLRLSEDVTQTLNIFMEYVIKNHHVVSDSPEIMQAFQLSLSWVAASISKQKLDKKETLLLVKQHLNYQCTEDQVHTVYSKMRSLKTKYLQFSEKSIDSGRDGILAEGHTSAGPSIKLSEIDNKIKQIEKKCSKRMNKLIRKQHDKIRAFHQSWEEKRLKLEEDHKLESTLIRSLHGQGPVRMDKLKRLNDAFAKKLEEHNLLKDAELKDLEAVQEAARNEERQKATNWHSQSVACFTELRALDLVEQRNPVEQCSENLEMPREKMPVSGVVDETRAVEHSKELPISVPEIVLNENVGHVHPVEFSSSSKGDADNFADMVVGQRDWNDKLTTSSVSSEGKVLENSEKVVVSSDCPVLQVAQEEVHGSPMALQGKNGPAIENRCIGQTAVADLEPFSTQSNVELQHQDQPPIENQCTSQTVSAELVDTVNPGISIVEQQVGDAAAVENRSILLPEVGLSELGNAVPTDTAVTAKCGQVDEVSAEESPSGSLQPAGVVVHQNSDQRRDSSLTAEVAVTELVPQESNPQTGENLGTMSNPLDRSITIPRDQSAGFYHSSRNNVAVSRAFPNAVEVPSPSVMQLGIDTSPFLGSSYMALPTHQVASWNSTSPLVTDPLHSEVERIQKQKEHLEKSHEDMASQLKSDCEKEIQEIRNKYEMKLKDNETELRSKKKILEKNQNKVLMNKVLAEAFRSKCLNLRPPGHPGMHQGMPPNFMQHLQQLSLQQPPVRVPAGPSNFQSSSTQPTATPAERAAMHQAQRPHSTRASPAAVQNVTPAIQRVLQAPALLPGTPSTSRPPPLISSITPSRNLRVGGEIRSAAPHLQSFRPPAVSQQRPLQPTLPLHPPAPLAPQSQPLSTSQRWVEPQIGGPSQHTSSLSAQGLLMQMDHRPRNPTSSPLPEICSTFSTLEPSDLETLANVQGNHTSASDVVCLSDDE